MRYGDTWPVSQQAGGPAITITPPRTTRDRAERLAAYDVQKQVQAHWLAIARILAGSKS